MLIISSVGYVIFWEEDSLILLPTCRNQSEINMKDVFFTFYHVDGKYDH